jgi:cobalt-zinc-cadmium efflux system outer membrane protein
MVRLAAIAGCAAVAGIAWADPLTLGEAFALAEKSSPSLAAERLQVPVANAGIGVARQRLNPEMALEEDKETPHDALALTFPIELGGKRGRRIDVAEAAVATSEAMLARATIAMRVKVRRAFFALAGAERSADDASSLAQLAARSRDAVSERFKSGDAPKLELLQAQMGAAQSENEATTAKAVAESRRAELNVLIGRAADAATTVTGDLGEGAIPDLATASSLAASGNGDLAVLVRRLHEQEQRLRLARAQKWPEFGVMGAVTHRDPDFDWGWRAGVTLTLPLFHNHGAEATLEEATLSQLTAERDAQSAEVRSKVASAWNLADARGKQYARYRDEILPTAQEVEAMAEDSYRSGQTGLVELIQSISSVRDARARAIEAGLAYQDALADLEEAMGAPVP